MHNGRMLEGYVTYKNDEVDIAVVLVNDARAVPLKLGELMPHKTLIFLMELKIRSIQPIGKLMLSPNLILDFMMMNILLI